MLRGWYNERMSKSVCSGQLCANTNQKHSKNNLEKRYIWRSRSKTRKSIVYDLETGTCKQHFTQFSLPNSDGVRNTPLTAKTDRIRLQLPKSCFTCLFVFLSLLNKSSPTHENLVSCPHFLLFLKFACVSFHFAPTVYNIPIFYLAHKSSAPQPQSKGKSTVCVNPATQGVISRVRVYCGKGSADKINSVPCLSFRFYWPVLGARLKP